MVMMNILKYGMWIGLAALNTNDRVDYHHKTYLLSRYLGSAEVVV